MWYYSACLPVYVASVRVSNRWHFHRCACRLICRVCVCGEGWLSSSQSGLVFALLIKTGLWVIYLKLSGISSSFLWRAKARRGEIKATDCSRLHIVLFLLGKRDLLRSWKKKQDDVKCAARKWRRTTMYGVTLWNLPLEQIITFCLLFIRHHLSSPLLNWKLGVYWRKNPPPPTTISTQTLVYYVPRRCI